MDKNVTTAQSPAHHGGGLLFLGPVIITAAGEDQVGSSLKQTIRRMVIFSGCQVFEGFELALGFYGPGEISSPAVSKRPLARRAQRGQSYAVIHSQRRTEKSEPCGANV
jgi:hypothetical protein